MSDEILLGNKKYVSSKRAAKECGYAQDYVGQLARGGVIDAQRVGGLWYVSMESLEAYKRNADAFTPTPPVNPGAPADPDTIISFDGRDYVSAARGAKLTGYNADYIGQLARGGKVMSRQVGNRWYVERNGLLAHKTQKDALLASVQAESVGLVRPEPVQSVQSAAAHRIEEPYLTYIREDDQLLPVLTKPERRVEEAVPVSEVAPEPAEATPVPIRVVRPAHRETPVRRSHPAQRPVRTSGMTMRTAVKSVAALTVVVIVSYGIVSFKNDSIYAVIDTPDAVQSSDMLAGAALAIQSLADLIERLVSTELRYERTK